MAVKEPFLPPVQIKLVINLIFFVDSGHMENFRTKRTTLSERKVREQEGRLRAAHAIRSDPFLVSILDPFPHLLDRKTQNLAPQVQIIPEYELACSALLCCTARNGY